MSFVFKALPVLAVAAAFASACSDVSSPTQASSVPMEAAASKGSGGGGGGGGSSTPQLVITTAPTVNTTGTWTGTTDGPDVVHNYVYNLTQTSAGMVSGIGTVTTPFTKVQYTVVGTVNGDTLMLYTGMVCSGCTLNPLYKGLVSYNSSRIDGQFLNGGVSPLTLFKQQ